MDEILTPPPSPILSKAKEFTTTLLGYLSVPMELEEGVMGDSPTISIRTSEARVLIGEDGARLEAMNHLLRRVLEKSFPEEKPHVVIDVNDHHRKRFDEIRDNARMGAQRVRYFKKEVELLPMNAYDRRIVHLTLQEYPDIATESVGLGKDRRVVIRPYPEVAVS